ncbi:hypothetical protein BSKO_02570 [Bryopsis sp. KO-2023]|nr:hypothetical protein BSKO_02570 [Bryopsis sp. KO-2023]
MNVNAKKHGWGIEFANNANDPFSFELSKLIYRFRNRPGGLKCVVATDGATGSDIAQSFSQTSDRIKSFVAKDWPLNRINGSRGATGFDANIKKWKISWIDRLAMGILSGDDRNDKMNWMTALTSSPTRGLKLCGLATGETIRGKSVVQKLAMMGEYKYKMKDNGKVSGWIGTTLENHGPDTLGLVLSTQSQADRCRRRIGISSTRVRVGRQGFRRQIVHKWRHTVELSSSVPTNFNDWEFHPGLVFTGIVPHLKLDLTSKF